MGMGRGISMGTHDLQLTGAGWRLQLAGRLRGEVGALRRELEEASRVWEARLEGARGALGAQEAHAAALEQELAARPSASEVSWAGRVGGGAGGRGSGRVGGWAGRWAGRQVEVQAPVLAGTRMTTLAAPAALLTTECRVQLPATRMLLCSLFS